MKAVQYDIRNMIYTVRGQQVMIDYELAMLYGVETRVLNQAVKRNIDRFPDRFRFQLTKDEYENLKSQFVISSLEEGKSDYGGRRKLPYVFTEQGIAMLASVLRSETAVQTSIHIMDSFVEMRRFLANNALLFERTKKIFFGGQIYDAFSLIVGLIQKAEREIVLIDGYVDVKTLNLLSKKQEKVSVTIYTQRKTQLTKTDCENFNAQYPMLEVKYATAFHDRFLIIDRETAYHVGASLKDAGKKCFGISLIQDEKIVRDILQRLELETEERDEAV